MPKQKRPLDRIVSAPLPSRNSVLLHRTVMQVPVRLDELEDLTWWLVWCRHRSSGLRLRVWKGSSWKLTQYSLDWITLETRLGQVQLSRTSVEVLLELLRKRYRYDETLELLEA